ncbi:MAG: copper resistance protein NlpE N-terminal domain-containing protein [Clostridiales bacterium]|nr:copper resistance protein NlpE N-terminal domain-containing protein [Clostridiales bacterium]
MKKIILLMALTFIMGVCLMACSGGAEGSYKFVSVKIGDQTYNVGDTIAELGEDALTSDFYILELKSDGNATLSSKMTGEEKTLTGTWTLSEDEKTITLTMEGVSENMTLTRDGNTLVMIQGTGDNIRTITLKR